MRDPVTMIGNRRNFDAALAEELEKARRTGADFCIALADLDRFKLVNDRFGHLVGDGLLRLFAEILAKNVRSVDRVARFGGEEFAVMLPGAGLDDAVRVAERIRKVLESKQWTIEPNRERVGKNHRVHRRRETAAGRGGARAPEARRRVFVRRESQGQELRGR